MILIRNIEVHGMPDLNDAAAVIRYGLKSAIRDIEVRWRLVKSILATRQQANEALRVEDASRSMAALAWTQDVTFNPPPPSPVAVRVARAGLTPINSPTSPLDGFHQPDLRLDWSGPMDDFGDNLFDVENLSPSPPSPPVTTPRTPSPLTPSANEAATGTG